MSRLSIEVAPELHKAIKTTAILEGYNVTDFVLEAVHQKLLEHSDKHRKKHKDAHAEECPLCAIYRPRGYNKRVLKALKESRTGKLKSYKSAKELFADLKL